MEELVKLTAQNLVKSKYAIALTGAGISTESGIADFRGPNGMWTKNPDAERQAYEMYGMFLRNPKEYWESRLLRPYMPTDLRQAKPNPGHYALAELEKLGLLKAVITQNIDGLHVKAGSQTVLEYHGSINRLRCSGCNRRFNYDEYDLMAMLEAGILPPLCPDCNQPIKDDVVHFNESIPPDVAEGSIEEVNKCDFMLICGTSAVVYPFASLPQMARQRKMMGGTLAVTIVEVNAEPTPLTTGKISDYLIRGKTAMILPAIVKDAKQILSML